jgi:hypothetical protein
MCLRFRFRRNLRLRGDANLQRVNPDGVSDVLELSRAEIADRKIKPSFDLAVRVLGNTDRARFGDAFQARGNIDAVAHQIPIGLLDHVPEVDANAELDAALGRQTGVALHHAALHFDGAAHGVNDAAELDDGPVARALNDSAMMNRNDGIGEMLRRVLERARMRSSSAPASRL